MSKQTIPSLNSRSFSEEWMDHPWVEWLSSNKQVVLWGLVGLFAVLLLSYRLLSVQTLNAEHDFFQAQNAFNQLQQMPQNQVASSTAFQDLKEIMAKHPELHAKYDGALAQLMLIENNLPEAKAFAQSTFERVRPDQLGLYENYAKTSLLIGEGKYPEALQGAFLLQAQLDKKLDKTSADQTLYTFNLLRLASLYQQLGHEQEELATWDTLLNWTEGNVQAVLTTYELFKDGRASLGQYIDQRKKTLAL